jgi:hypothetical protein
VEKIMLGQKTVESALREAAESCNKILSESKE